MGILFRSLANFLQRLIDPNDFAVVQAESFARFNAIDTTLLDLAAVPTAVGLAEAWALRHSLDVVALGRDTSVSLGVRHRRMVIATLVVVAVLVSVSTALVGPVTFFGLLVSALAHLAMRSHRHAFLLPAAALIAGNWLAARPSSSASSP